jgi:platelet-activating factor acetylhydrolase
MTDESLLATDLLQEIPDEHRPTDQWIAAKLRVDHEFRTRVAAGMQRKFKRNLKGQRSYSTEEEVWMHFKPDTEKLENWINEEGRGEERVGNEDTVEGNNSGHSKGKDAASSDISLSKAEKDATVDRGIKDHVDEQDRGSGSGWKDDA